MGAPEADALNPNLGASPGDNVTAVRRSTGSYTGVALPARPEMIRVLGPVVRVHRCAAVLRYQEHVIRLVLHAGYFHPG